jgi:hypothetical protein
MYRRSFFRLLGGAAALASAPRLIRAQTLTGPTAPSKRLNVGCIGHGSVAPPTQLT